MTFSKKNKEIIEAVTTELISLLKPVVIEDVDKKSHKIILYTFELDSNIDQLQISINEYSDKDKEGNPTYAVHIDVPI